MTSKLQETRNAKHIRTAAPRLDLTAELPELRDYRFVRRFVYLAVVSLVLAIFWAAQSPISEVITGKGKITTISSVLRIEHSDGGRVIEVFAKPGDAVQAGDPIVAFDVDTLMRERATILARKTRLEAEAQRIAFILDNRSGGIGEHNMIDPRDLSQEEQVFWAEQEYLEAQISLLEAAAIGTRNQITAQSGIRLGLEAELDLARTRADRIEGLFERGSAVRVDAESALQDVLRVERALLDLDATEIAAKDRLKQNAAQQRELLATRFRDAAQRRSELTEARTTVTQELAAIDAQIDRAMVTAPIAGTVQTLPVAGVGDVVLRSELIAEIVPANSAIQTEIEISADQIGDIATGMEARIKVATFDFAWFGSVMGEVTSISPTSAQNELGETVFQVVVTLPGGGENLDLGGRPLRPGMTVTADILGETKTVLTYLLKPLRSLRDRAFTEA